MFFLVAVVELFNCLICFGFQSIIYFLQFLVGWQIRYVRTHLQNESCNLHILVETKIAIKKLRLMEMLLEKKMSLCWYSSEKHVMEHTLDCHIPFETVTKTGLLVLNFVSLYNFAGNCETAVFYVLQVLSRPH